jgi:hypothetical protein
MAYACGALACEAVWAPIQRQKQKRMALSFNGD